MYQVNLKNCFKSTWASELAGDTTIVVGSAKERHSQDMPHPPDLRMGPPSHLPPRNRQRIPKTPHHNTRQLTAGRTTGHSDRCLQHPAEGWAPWCGARTAMTQGVQPHAPKSQTSSRS